VLEGEEDDSALGRIFGEAFDARRQAIYNQVSFAQTVENHRR
jgi:hypothetical protein